MMCQFLLEAHEHGEKLKIDNKSTAHVRMFGVHVFESVFNALSNKNG